MAGIVGGGVVSADAVFSDFLGVVDFGVVPGESLTPSFRRSFPRWSERHIETESIWL